MIVSVYSMCSGLKKYELFVLIRKFTCDLCSLCTESNKKNFDIVDFEDRCFSTYSSLFQWILQRKYLFQIYKTISVSLALQFLRTGMIRWGMETKRGQDEWELVRKLWESAERGNKGSDWTGSCDWRDERWAKHKRIKKCDDWRGDEGPGNNSLSPCWRCLGQHWAWFCYQNKGLGQIITSEIISRTCHSW